MARRMFAFLVGRLPQSHRSQFGAAMIADFERLESEARQRGRLVWLSVVAREYWGVLLAGWRERGARVSRKKMGRLPRIRRDVRLGVRSVARAPGFSFLVVLTLGLGIGGATAIFSVVDAVLLGELPYSDPDNLLLITNRHESSGLRLAPISGPDFDDIENEVPSISQLAAGMSSSTNLTGVGPALMVSRAWVTANFFEVLGVAPALGRSFRSEEQGTMAGGVDPDTEPPLEPVVISYSLWQSLFDGSEHAIGSRIELSGAPNEVIGVMPPEFELLLPDGAVMASDLDVWSVLPIDLTRDPRDFGRVTAFGRVAPGSDTRTVERELELLSQRHREQFEFHSNADIHLEASALLQESVRESRPIVIVMFAAVGLLLLVATANVSNLMLVRGNARANEFTVKSALGASRFSLLTQFVAEALVLSAIALALGAALGALGIEALVALNPGGLPRLEDASMNGRVLLFAAFVSTLAALAASAVPAVVGSRTNLAGALRGRGAAESTGNGRAVSTFVVVQVALSMVLAVGSALVIRSTAQLQSVNLGYSTTSLASFDVNPPFWRYRSIDDRVQFLTQVAEAIGDVPGVRAVSGALPLPLVGAESPMGNSTGPYSAVGSGSEGWSRNTANYRSVLPGYFEVLNLELLRGRSFNRLDNASGVAPTVVIDARMAELVWGDDDPVGKQIMLSIVPPDSPEDDAEPTWAEVVGVVPNTRLTGLRGAELPTVYFPARFSWPTTYSFIISGQGDANTYLSAIQDAVGGVDPGVAVYSLTRLDAGVDRALAPHRFALALLSVFATIAIALGAVGVYGVLSYVIGMRRREIGVKLAFGAGNTRVEREFVWRGLKMAAIGIAVGTVAAVLASSVLDALLYDVSRLDPLTYGIASGVLLGVTAAASFIPARRASQFDPVVTLRED